MLSSKDVDVFRTRRLTGRRLTEEGIVLQRLLFMDPGTMRTLAADGKIASNESIEERCAKHLEHWVTHGFGVWQIFETESGDYVGQCGLRNTVLRGEPEIELCYALRSPYFRRGLGTEMAWAVVEIGFRELGLASLVAFTLPDNVPSRRVMEKMGMRYEGVIEHAGLPHVLYRIEPVRA